MKYFLFLVFIVFFFTGKAQVGDEIRFVSHLIDKGHYSEAIFLIDNRLTGYNHSQQDSLLYYHGWANYALKNLEQSTQSLLRVSRKSPFFYKSHFFAGYNQIYLDNFGKAQQIFVQMDISEEPFLSLVNLEFAGIEMLKGNRALAGEKLDAINRTNPVLNEHITALKAISAKNGERRSKSPVLAGIMSGIVPGSGKIYAGKTGAGIASFVGNVGFGLITWENYNKRGLTNPKTLIFGSLFAVNYISNIYGSVLSVKVSENEYNKNVQNQILFQLHIPLRNFFN